MNTRIRQANQFLDKREQQLKRALSEKESLLQRQKIVDQKLQVALTENRLYAEHMQQQRRTGAFTAHVNQLSENPPFYERMMQAEKALTIREVELKQREMS